VNDLYQEELREIYKNPSNKGKIANPSIAIHHKNPMCGDELELHLKVDDKKITQAKFHGSLCAVSVISSDVLLNHIIGKTISEAKNISKEQLLEWLHMNLTTSRVSCATLVLSALKKALENYD
jgi:nitrogen fixation NifU-like protein